MESNPNIKYLTFEIIQLKNQIENLQSKYDEMLKLMPILIKENIRLSLNNYYLCFKEKLF